MLKSKIISLSLIAAAVMPTAAATLGDDVRTADNRVVYEVFVRNFSSSSKLTAVTAALPRLKDLGVDVVWLMPIYKGGDKDKWGTYSSPYAVKDYKQIDPLYGTDADLRALVEDAHSRGMEVWLDWVANHTATDAVWTTTNPEYYGSSFRHPNGWSDVYQLDFSNQNMRAAMIDAMKYWVENFDIDGFRCDYADGVPRDFWAQARAAVDAVKPLTWLAESAGQGDNVQLLKTFDYNYAWTFNDLLLEAGTSASCAPKVAEALYTASNPRSPSYYTGGKSRLVYLSNHDVVQDKSGTPDRHFGSNLKPMTVLMFTAAGMPLIYNGQEVNWSTGQVLLAEKSVINWNNADNGMKDLITSLTSLRHRTPVFNAGSRGGEYVRHTTGTHDQSVVVFERRRNTESAVVMLNFSMQEATVTVDALPDAQYSEWFTGATADFAASKTVTIPAKGYMVWLKTDDSPARPGRRALLVDDRTGWNSFYIYGWYGECTERFGAWPGKQADKTVTGDDGTVYKVWELPDTWWYQTYHLIFNNNAGTQIEGKCDYAFDRNYCIRVTASSVQEVAYPAAGVQSVDAASGDAPARYYNMQGVEVTDPQHGIFIRRAGGKTTKVVIP